MLKFFRRIRQRLLTESKFSNYFFYAIGEILLVVIGILIALSINNWNENKKKNETVKIYLTNYIEDLKDDEKRMARLEEHNMFRYHSLQYVLKISGELQYKSNDKSYIVLPLPSSPNFYDWEGAFPEEFNKNFIQITFEASQAMVPFQLNQSTMSEMKSTGVFSYIDNHKLKDSINNYYKQWNWRLGENQEQLVWGLIEKWEDALAKSGVTTSDPFETNGALSFLNDDPARLAILRRLIREAGWIAYCASIVRKNAEDLKTIIEEEINSNEY